MPTAFCSTKLLTWVWTWLCWIPDPPPSNDWDTWELCGPKNAFDRVQTDLLNPQMKSKDKKLEYKCTDINNLTFITYAKSVIIPHKNIRAVNPLNQDQPAETAGFSNLCTGENHQSNGIINTEVFLQLLWPNYLHHVDSLADHKETCSSRSATFIKSCH